MRWICSIFFAALCFEPCAALERPDVTFKIFQFRFPTLPSSSGWGAGCGRRKEQLWDRCAG